MKKFPVLYLLVGLIGTCWTIFPVQAQTHTQYQDVDTLKVKPPKERQFQMNLTPLLVKFVPFNRETSFTGPYNFMYKRFRGNHGFRIALGARINPDAFTNNDDSHINVRIGYERRYDLSPKWKLNRGVDWVGSLGGFNVPRPTSNPSFPFLGSPGAATGVGFSLGIEYRIHPKLSISTESMLFLGAQTNTVFTLTVVPPLGIFISANL